MSNTEKNIRKSLQKRQDAMQKHVARQEAFLIRKEKSLQKRQDAMQKHVARQEVFLIRKEQMIKDIELARTYWKNTLVQLPKSEFTF